MSLDEVCDDGNLASGDGCDSECEIEPLWKCYTERNQGPSVCYQLRPPIALGEQSEVYFNRFFIYFDRKLKFYYNFSNITTVTIPNLKNESAFSYNLSTVKNSTNRFYIDYIYNDDLINMNLSVKFYALKP